MRRFVHGGVRLALATVAAIMSVAAVSHEVPALGGGFATFIVTSTSDAPDADTGDGVCDNGLGACTLRAAIEQANATVGLDTISFSIGSGVQTIRPATALPAIMDAVVIDGTTQPGFAGKPIIELNGDAAPDYADGLFILAGGSTVRGLVVNGFNEGILLMFGGGNTVAGNFVGTNVAGTGADGNFNGILISESTNNTIGGTTPADRNILSGNSSAGVYVAGADGNTIMGNYVGTDYTGLVAIANDGGGVGVNNLGSGNLIGGVTQGAGNLISGNGNGGMFLGLVAENNVVQGNLIGTDATGSTPLPNNGPGVAISSEGNNTVGGIVPGARNIISGNAGVGIWAAGGPDGDTLRGNSVHSNGGKGIYNPSGEPASPVVTSAGPVVGTAAPDCTIDVYSDDADEGRIHYGFTTADAQGDWTYGGPVGGPNLTATCTDVGGTTSEFSAPFAVGCAPDDADCEGVLDQVDNCPHYANPDQADGDGDGIGDICEPPSADVDCNGTVNSVDALKVLRSSAGLPVQQGGVCERIGHVLLGGKFMGDINCSGAVNSVDALIILRMNAGLAVLIPSECPPPS